jgi:hypothetical protein
MRTHSNRVHLAEQAGSIDKAGDGTDVLDRRAVAAPWLVKNELRIAIHFVLDVISQSGKT